MGGAGDDRARVVMSCRVVSRHVVSCRVTPCRVTSCHVMSSDALELIAWNFGSMKNSERFGRLGNRFKTRPARVALSLLDGSIAFTRFLVFFFFGDLVVFGGVSHGMMVRFIPGARVPFILLSNGVLVRFDGGPVNRIIGMIMIRNGHKIARSLLFYFFSDKTQLQLRLKRNQEWLQFSGGFEFRQRASQSVSQSVDFCLI